jgi:predicted PurR-regulated permease PerM
VDAENQAPKGVMSVTARQGRGVSGLAGDGPTSTTLRLLVAAAALAIVAGALHAARDIVAPLMLALALTIVFHPLRRRLGRHLPSWLASTILLVSAYLLLAGLAVLLLVSLGRLANLLPQYQSEFKAQTAELNDTLNSWGITDRQIDAMRDSLDPSQLADVASSILGDLFGVLSNFFFLVTLLLFMAFDGAQIDRLMAHARGVRPHAVDALASFARGTRSYLSVSAIFGLIVAVIDTAALAWLGVPGAFVWGVLAFVTNFIPNIGFVIGVIPPALIALLEEGPELMLAVIVLYSVINFVIQSIIQPRVVGGTVGLSTTLTFLSLVFWTWILGPLGAILAVPMSLFARAVLVEADPTHAWMTPLVSGRPPPEEPGERKATAKPSPPVLEAPPSGT